MNVFTVLFIVVAAVLFLGDHAGGIFAWMLDSILKMLLEALKGNLGVALGVLLLLMYIPKAFERPRDEGNWLLYRHRRRGGWW